MIKTKSITTNIIKPLPILVTLVTAFGVLVHDLHVDRATTVAIALPVLMASAAGMDKLIGGDAHVHVERASPGRPFSAFKSSLPNTQPPRDDEKKYASNKRASLGFGSDQGYVWPSA